MKVKLYWVDWYTSGGHLYKSTMNVPYEAIKKYKRIAKLLGDTIKYEPM